MRDRKGRIVDVLTDQQVSTDPPYEAKMQVLLKAPAYRPQGASS
jgi:hypothetical protein